MFGYEAACGKLQLDKWKTDEQAALARGEDNITLKCSATNQDSKAEYNREVATPQKTLPTSRIWKLFQCLVKQPKAYVATYVSAAFFLPL